MGSIDGSGLQALCILDACVLIDFCKEDPSLLSLAARSVGTLIVPSPILQEVKQLDEQLCDQLGLVVLEPELDEVTAATTKRGGLSFRDRICLVVARKRQAIIYSNDRLLLTTAANDGIEGRWGLQLLLDLASLGQISKKEALKAAEGICQRSRFPTDDLLELFISKLK